MKIFIGLEDTASQASDLKRGFGRLNIESYIAVNYTNAITANEVDEVIGKDNLLSNLPIPSFRLKQFLRTVSRRRHLLREAVQKYDSFIFIYHSFYEDARDLKYLNSLGKKIVVFFMGSEQRWKNSYEQEMKSFGIPTCYQNLQSDYETSFKKLRITLQFLRNVERYADVIYSLPNQSQLSLRPYSHLYIPVDLSLIEQKPLQRKIPVVAHAPSNRAIKGTNFVLDSFEKLKNDGIEFEVRLIENVPYHEALKLYEESDIVIGELFIPSAGKLDREALAAGKVVLSSVRRDYIDNLPPDCPIIDINPETVYEELKKIILDYPRRVELAKKGRSFVEKYHDIDVICRDVLQKLEDPPAEVDFDFYPTFFREKFVPESEKHAKLYNHWTQLVSETDWYKKYVPAGERDGLRF